MSNIQKMVVPSFTLSHQNHELNKELMQCFAKVIEQGQLILGKNVSDLEQQVADYSNVKYGIGVANGSDALYLSLLASGIGAGDEVITTPFTFFATAGSICRTGAMPVFVDIRPDTWNIDADLIEEKISSKTKAILPVHLYGCPAEMDKIITIAKKYDLIVIEDAAQAIGANYNGKPIGSFGDSCCFSFFPTKNLGAFGDAGMVVTNDATIANKIKLLRVHGSKVKYNHEILGCNSRLDELQAALLTIKIKYLAKWTNRRREIASLYNKLLTESIDTLGCEITLPVEPANTFHVYHQYTIQTKNRDQLQNYLSEKGISSTVYYPIPMHLQKVFAELDYKIGDYPIAETASNEVLSLPMFPELEDEEICYVVHSIAEYFRNQVSGSLATIDREVNESETSNTRKNN